MTLVLALLGVPLVLGPAAWAVRPARLRMALLWLAAALHLALVGAAWWARPVSAPGAWLAIDALGLLVLTTVSLVFAVVAVYATAYLDGDRAAGERVFITCLFGFLASATLVALSHHMALMWIGMETTTLSMAPLVFYRRNKRSLEAVWKYLMLSSVGIALALFGTFFLAASQASGRPLVLEDLLAGAAHLEPGLLRSAFVFLLVGYGTKMGLAPLHAWKPDTYGEAPSLVAGLMAGALTSCAFLGLARATEVMAAAGQLPFAQPPLLALGMISLVLSAGFMVVQSDLKRLFAYSSVEHMGLLAIALGIGGLGSYGAALHLMVNGLIKVAMFIAVGNVVQISQTSEAAATRGLLWRAPWTSVVLFAGLFAVTGSPPFGLFVSEFAILGAVFHAHHTALALAIVVLLSIIFVAMARMLLRVIFSDAEPGAPALRETAPRVAGPMLMVGVVLLLGLYLPHPLRAVLAEAARALGGTAP